jgi:AbrB family looped-hinge helix DNA binding protein
MRINRKGQVTIPIEIRRAAGLLPNTDVKFVYEDDTIILRKTLRGWPRETLTERALRKLRADRIGDLTSDEIMALTRGER